MRINLAIQEPSAIPTRFANYCEDCLTDPTFFYQQGIRVEFMTPASPQQNGSHERMHRDLKAEATKPPSLNLPAQRKRLERWKRVYNFERPHEALDMLRPAEIYQASARRLGDKYKMRYPESHQVRRVDSAGFFTHDGSRFYAGEIYSGCRVGLYENADGVFELHYANLHLADLDYEAERAYGPGACLVEPGKGQVKAKRRARRR